MVARNRAYAGPPPPGAMKRQRKQSAVASDPTSGRLLLAAFFTSGLAGVMHEVVWSRQLVRLIGAESFAQAVVLATFMGGLAAGAALIGPRADRGRPLRLYVRLEVIIAAYALAIPLLLRLAGSGYEALARHFFERDGIRLVLRFVLAALIVAPPALLMGGTLPLLARRMTDDRAGDRGGATRGQVQARVGALYALNSLGAVVGTAAAGFVALPLLGTWGALVAGVAANLVAALLVAPAARREPAPAGPALVEAAPVVPGSPVLLGALFASGLAAMGYEVLFVRVVGLAFGSSTHSFTVMLICFIGGIALGSGVVAWIGAGRGARWGAGGAIWRLGVSQLVLVAAFLAATPLLARLAYLTDRLRVSLQGVSGGFELQQLGAAALCLGALLVPTVCLGLPLPLVSGLRAGGAAPVGARVGGTYAWGTAGNVVGVALTTLVLLPRLGLERSFHLLWGLNLAAGLALLALAREVPPLRRWGPLGPFAAAAALYLAAGTGWTATLRLVPDHLLLRTGPEATASEAERAAHPTTSFAAWRARYLLTAAQPPFPELVVEEDAHDTVVAFGGDSRTEGGIVLSVNNKVDASSVSDIVTQMLLAHGPMFLAPRARAALVIGYGAGITAGSILAHPVDSADLVEISPAVLRVDRLFAKANRHALTDPRVRVHVDDGQSFLRAVPRRYDIIVSEPSNPWIAGIGDLFTREFFELARARLNPGGVFTFWFHTYAQSDETTRLLMRTLGSVFPHAEIFVDDMGDIVAVASMTPLVPDFALMEKRFEALPIRRDFRRWGIEGLAAFLTRHRVTQSGAEALAGPGPLNHVARERLQYSGPRALFAGTDSFFFEERDPFLSPPAGAPPGATQSLYDRYRRYRAQVGRPLTEAEVEDAARFAGTRGDAGAAVAKAIRAREE